MAVFAGRNEPVENGLLAALLTTSMVVYCQACSKFRFPSVKSSMNSLDI